MRHINRPKFYKISSSRETTYCSDTQAAKTQKQKLDTDIPAAFLEKFVNPAAHSMSCQTRGADGRPVDVIPATPDAEPGYHAGLSIIAFLNIISGAETRRR